MPKSSTRRPGNDRERTLTVLRRRVFLRAEFFARQVKRENFKPEIS
jgi:hypothetical protein